MTGTTLRWRLSASESVLMPGVWDALSARLAAQAGFGTVFLSGYAVSGTLLGLPDYGYLTQTEMAEVARRVCSSNPDLEVVVDADTGYGNPLNTMRTVELWQQAGASGLFLEDQVWPKRCGHMAGKQVIDTADWLAKLKAAVHAADDLHITARTDARAAIGLDAAIERAKMARDTGVDALFVEAPETIDELERIAAALPDITLVANMVEGVTTGYRKTLEIIGVGYRAEKKGKSLVLNVGYSHPVEYVVPEGVSVAVVDGTQLKVSGIDKQLVGQVSARIRSFRPPEPYKGKGVRYKDERVRRKAGKTVA